MPFCLRLCGSSSIRSREQSLSYSCMWVKKWLSHLRTSTCASLQYPIKVQMMAAFSAASWLPQKRQFLRPKASGRTLFSLALFKLRDNLIERGIRKVKIKMQNSGTFRSDQGADAFLTCSQSQRPLRNTTTHHTQLSGLCPKHGQLPYGYR